MSIAATFEGRCGLCDEPIEPGEQITEVDGEWCHAGCAAEHEGIEDDG